MIKQDKRCAEEDTADDIGDPMHARQQPSDGHKDGKGTDDGQKNASADGVSDACVQLHHRGRHNRQYQQCCRGRIGRLQDTVYQHGAVIHDSVFKKQKRNHHDDVKPAEDKQ